MTIQFRCDPYRDLYQDVLKVQTATYRLSLSYDDVTGEYDLTVYFKAGYGERSASIGLATYKDAIARATRFIAEHPAPMPVCCVDY